jgi:hypothetical protein
MLNFLSFKKSEIMAHDCAGQTACPGRPTRQYPSGQYSAGMARIGLGESASGVLAASAPPGAPARAASAESPRTRDWHISPVVARTIRHLPRAPCRLGVPDQVGCWSPPAAFCRSERQVGKITSEKLTAVLSFGVIAAYTA